MKYLPLLFVLFSLFHSVHAQNLCDASCEFSATFPEGGSLEAIDELTLTFGAGGELILGTGGTVNTAIQPSSLDFSSGGTLHLSAGESITFGPDGSLVLGTGGNMDAESYSLYTTGDISIAAAGGNQSINITGDWGAAGTLSFTSKSFEIGSLAQLNLENQVFMNVSDSIINNGTLVLSTGNESPAITGGTETGVTLQSGSLVLSPGMGTVGTIETIGTLQSGSLVLTSGSGVINITAGPFTPIDNNSEITIAPDRIQLLQSLDGFNGMEIPTSDGKNCIVESPECVTDDGTVYVLDAESKLVKKEAPSDTSTNGKSGSFTFPILGFFMILLLSCYGPRKAKRVQQ